MLSFGRRSYGGLGHDASRDCGDTVLVTMMAAAGVAVVHALLV